MSTLKKETYLGKEKERASLGDIDIGEKAIVMELLCKGAYRRRLLDLGLVPGTIVKAVMRSPLGTPIAYDIRGSLIALRQKDATNIIVKKFVKNEEVKGVN